MEVILGIYSLIATIFGLWQTDKVGELEARLEAAESRAGQCAAYQENQRDVGYQAATERAQENADIRGFVTSQQFGIRTDIKNHRSDCGNTPSEIGARLIKRSLDATDRLNSGGLRRPAPYGDRPTDP